MTDEEIEQIRAMDLTICLQQDHLDDAMKLIQQAFQDACDELGITLGSIWMAADQSGAAARSDYENFLSVTDEYDAFFTCLSDAFVEHRHSQGNHGRDPGWLHARSAAGYGLGKYGEFHRCY